MAFRQTLPMTRPAMMTPTSVSGTMGLYPRPSPFFESFPGSADGARSVAVDEDQSQSVTNSATTANVLLAPWDSGQEREIFDGQLTFSMPRDFGGIGSLGSREKVRLQTPLLNIRHVNTFLRLGYLGAHEAFQKKDANNDLLIQRDFSFEELQHLLSRPVRDWHRIDFVKERLRVSSDDSAAQKIAFLSERLLVQRLNTFGWIHGQVPTDGRPLQIAVRRSGTIEHAENIWSSDVYPGDNLYLVLRRVYDSGKGEWAQFAFVPWFGPSMPTPQECAYMDYSGHVDYGCAIYIGSLDRITHDYALRPEELPQLLGIQPCQLQRVRIGPEPGCLRITALGSKNKLSWLY